MRCAATGESIPPDSRHATRPAVPVGQTSSAARLAEEVERLIGEHLDMDHQIGVVEIHGPAARFLDAAADLPLDLRRGHRKTLVRTADRHAKAGARASAKVGENRVRDRLQIARRPVSGVSDRPLSIGSPAYEKFAIPKTREMRSPTWSGDASGPRTTSIRPISARTERTSEIRHAPAGGCARAGQETMAGSFPSARAPDSGRRWSSLVSGLWALDFGLRLPITRLPLPATG